MLGDDALACLRDLKKWLKLYDEKANRLDVARVLAETNLVRGDLLQILASWPEHDTNNRLKSKIALACLELLVPLTWPLEKDAQQMTVNHHRHIPFLQVAQLSYKRSIINFDGARILHTAVRCALPSMAEALKDRSSRDEGIIKLVLYFLRDMVMIAPPENISYDGDEAEISRSATIDTFDYQDILHLLLTLSSTMGEDFNTQDVIVMEIIFHLVKGVDVEKLFMSEEENRNSGADELVRLLEKEAAMLRSYKVNAPTRHNRFGTMAWMKRADHQVTTISGQAVFSNNMATLAKMDSTKKFKPPRKSLKGEATPLDFDTPVQLTIPATKKLRSFVEDFLDSGFNPLFNHIRKAIDREAERILEYHPRQFFYLISWFLEAERVRRKNMKPTKGAEPESYALVASGINQEMFVTLNRAMDMFFENKQYQDLSASMRCFTQVLLTVQEMSESSLEDDQEASENILSRIFYEETTHDRVANITRTYKDQGFGYLDSCTELAHTYIRVLEQYSKQNVDLQVRSRRRVRRKKKATAKTENDEDNPIDESDPEDVARAEATSSERKFDFKRFAARFLTQGCIDTFVKFTGYYEDLKSAQLKRCHRFFYRIAFKQEFSVILFRVDIMHLLYKMIQGPGGLDPQSAGYKEWHELVRQLFKRCIKKIQDRPELVVEMLFSKTNSIAHYLEYGYEKQTAAVGKPRPAAEMVVKGRDGDEALGIVVTALLDRFEGELVQWVKAQLAGGEEQRRGWEGLEKALPSVERDYFADYGDEERLVASVEKEQQQAPPIGMMFLLSNNNSYANEFTVLKPPNDRTKTALFKNGLLRLLLTLVSCTRLGSDDDPDSTWVIPSPITADQLKHSHNLIKQYESTPPIFPDGTEASSLIKRKSALPSNRKIAFFDDDDSGLASSSDGELLFEPGGPTAMKSNALKELKKSRRKRRRREGSEEGGGLDDELLEARREARRKREREKNAKIKSELFVRDSDDETDVERDRIFFAREEELRRGAEREMLRVLKGGGGYDVGAKNGKKEKKTVVEVGSESESEEDNELPVTKKSKKRSSSVLGVDSDDDDDDDEMHETRGSSSTPKDDILQDSEREAGEGTPLSSPHLKSSQAKRRKLSARNKGLGSDTDDDGGVGVDVTRAEEEGREEGRDEGEDMEMGELDTATNGVEDADEDEDVVMLVNARPARKRVRAGFVVDSSDEE